MSQFETTEFSKAKLSRETLEHWVPQNCQVSITTISKDLFRHIPTGQARPSSTKMDFQFSVPRQPFHLVKLHQTTFIPIIHIQENTKSNFGANQISGTFFYIL